MKAYKGFNADMTCRGFKYQEGKEFETSDASVCNSGFHACEYPLDCFGYYEPGESVYHEVELDGKIDKQKGGDTKLAATKIKIGARLSIAGLVKAAIEYTMSKVIPGAKSDENHGSASATGDKSAASATGYKSAASATGYKSAASATGYNSVASATGYNSAASATGYNSAASATGDKSAASATGDKSVASATGDKSVASATGDNSAASATGDKSAASATGYNSVASATGDKSVASATGDNSAASADNETAIGVAWGLYGKAKGVKGAHIVLADWRWCSEKSKHVLHGARMVRIDGEKYKPDTWYTIRNGEVVKA